jgi:hypothetical protein
MLALASAEWVALIGAGATITAAAILAGVAAVTTNGRLTQQILAESEKQQRELAHDQERQQRDLTHARELADLADLRVLLDEAAVALDRSEDRVLAIHSTVRLTTDPSRRKDLLSDETEALGEALTEVLVIRARLQVRLGGGAINLGFGNAVAAMYEVEKAGYASETDTDDAKVKAVAALDRFQKGKDTFLKAALERVGDSASGS